MSYYTVKYILDLFQITRQENGNYSLDCSRPGECEADRVHACGIEHIKETDKLLKFVNCSLVEGFKTKKVPIEEVFLVKWLFLKISLILSSSQSQECINFIIMYFFSLYITMFS